MVLFSSQIKIEPQPVEIKLEGFAFDPPVVAVRLSQSFSVLNNSPRSMSCRAVGDGAFFFENLNQGGRFEGAVEKEGIWVLRCERYPFLKLVLAAGPVAYAATTDAGGRFNLGMVAAGDYTLRVLVGEKWAARREVKVGPAPMWLDLGRPETAPVAPPESPKIPPAVEPTPPAPKKPEIAKPAPAKPEAVEPRTPAKTAEPRPGEKPPVKEPAPPEKPKPAEPEKPTPKHPPEDATFKNVEPEIEVEDE